MMIKSIFLGGYIINLYIEPNAACISCLHILLTSLWPIVEGEQYLYYSEEILSHSRSKCGLEPSIKLQKPEIKPLF